MHGKLTWDLTTSRRHIATIAMVVVASAMLAGSLGAQSLGILWERMPPGLEDVVRAIFGEQVDTIITLGPVEHHQPGLHERMFLTAERYDNDDVPVTRMVDLEHYSINLRVMPEELEEAVMAAAGPEVDAVITLGPDGQERLLLTKEQFADPSDLSTLGLQKFPILTPKKIIGVTTTILGFGYLMWESSPDCQCRSYPGVGCVPLRGHKKGDPQCP